MKCSDEEGMTIQGGFAVSPANNLRCSNRSSDVDCILFLLLGLSSHMFRSIQLPALVGGPELTNTLKLMVQSEGIVVVQYI